MNEKRKAKKVLLVTGLSGAGKTTALKTLEDLGWEAVDNFPIRLARHAITRRTQRTGRTAGSGL
jgi:RNase adapter protein RapZ